MPQLISSIKSLTATEWFAIIGAATGVLGLFLHFMRSVLERARVQFISTFDSHTYYFINPSNDQGAAVISIIVRNCSRFPITIDDVWIKGNNRKHPHVYNSDYNVPTVKLETGGFMYYEPYNILKLPYDLPPFSSKKISLHVYRFDKYVNGNNSVNVKAVFHTPRKTFTYRTKILEVKKYHQLRKKQFKD